MVGILVARGLSLIVCVLKRAIKNRGGAKDVVERRISEAKGEMLRNLKLAGDECVVRVSITNHLEEVEGEYRVKKIWGIPSRRGCGCFASVNRVILDGGSLR